MGAAEDEVRFEAEAGGIAFMLLGAAFHELAVAIRTADPEHGHALLHSLQEGVSVTLQQFAVDVPGMASSPILREAERRVRKVMRAAQGLEAGKGGE